MPQLGVREPGWCMDTGELFVGVPGGSKKVGADIEQKLTALEPRVAALEQAMPQKLTANKAASQTELLPDADLPAAVAAFNALLAAMKAAGMMNQ